MKTEEEPLFGVALISSDSINGQRLLFRYPVNYCGEELTPLFQTTGDYSGWKRFAQFFNPFVKMRNINISIGDQLTMIPRCLTDEESIATADSSAFVLVILINSIVVTQNFSMQVFEEFTTNLSLCLMKEEKRHNYLSQEKTILLNVLNEYKHSKEHTVDQDQFVLNIQLEKSMLARELSHVYHEVNCFHQTSILFNNMLLFNYTLPTKSETHSIMKFYTSDHDVSEKNIEEYYSILLYHEPSYYLRSEKAASNSFLSRFIALASPFVTMETMSVMLDVPIQKVFATALSLKAANTATLHMQITERTHFTIAPGFSHERMKTEQTLFESKFKELGTFLNMLSIFSNSPSLERVFSQYNMKYIPYQPIPAETSLIYDALLFLMQHHIITPVILYCQYIPEYIGITSKKEEEEHYDDEYTGSYNSVHYMPDTHSLRKMATTSEFSSGYMDTGSLETHKDSILQDCTTSRLQNSVYYPYLAHITDTYVETSDMLSQSGEPAERSREALSRLNVPKSGSSPSIHLLGKIPTENRIVLHSNLLEKCIPLMKERYCVDEMCYKLGISHNTFWEMVKEAPKQFFVYYVANDK